MPEISRFFGIVIRMFYNDHAPPHFHAEYGEHEALIEPAECPARSLPWSRIPLWASFEFPA